MPLMQEPPAVVATAVEPGASAAVAALEAQVQAWNAGDLDTALSAYWNSPRMRWVSRTGVELGYDAFAAGMRSDFADPTRMGVYTSEVLHAEALGFDAAVVVQRWRIDRDGARIMGGVSTQLWRRLPGGWKVVLEHAS